MKRTKGKMRSRSLTHTILTACLVILIVAFSFGLFFIANDIIEIKKDIVTLRISVSDLERAELSVGEKTDYNNWYVTLSEKADAEMDRLITVVGLLATVYTVFGALIVFRAPREIDIRIGKLEELLSQANKSAEDAQYQAEIIDAILNGYNGEMTNYDKLRRISAVIEKYPEKTQAYFQRAFIYDNMKKYDEAIHDYKIGHRYNGVEESSYYCDIGIAYEGKGAFKKAISAYSKAIKIDPEDPAVYVNRAGCYVKQEKYDLALDDFNKAISLDEDFKKAYINRSIAYGKLLNQESDKCKQQKYYDLLMSDLHRALELDPEDTSVKKMLMHRMSAEMNPGRMIASLDEKFGDLEISDGNAFNAFKHYIDAARYYMVEAGTREDQNAWENVEGLICKIYDIEEDEIIAKSDAISQSLSEFCELLGAAAVLLYIKGKKDVAEKGFLILLKYDQDKEAARNLAFMKRRGETTRTEQPVTALLNQADNQKSAIWCVNSALCYIEKVEGYEYDWDKAIELLNSAEDEFDEAIQWWSDTEIVGEAESNLVMLLFHFVKKYTFEDQISLEERANIARENGYCIPDNIEQDVATPSV